MPVPQVLMSVATLEAHQARQSEQAEPTPLSIVVVVGSLSCALCVVLHLCLREARRTGGDQDGETGSE
jgi:alkylhydroperoxidase family enzyme